MGRLFGGSTGIYFEEKVWEVFLWDPFYGNRIHPSGEEIINCLRIVNGPLDSGSTCTLEHTGYSFSQITADDTPKLLGAIVQVAIDGEVCFVGTITDVEKRIRIDETRGTDSLIYTARGIEHMLADKELNADFPGGISSGGLAGVLAGGAYTSYTARPDGSYGGTLTITQYDPPLLPCNEDGDAIVALSPEIINAGISSPPRRYSDEPRDVLSVLVNEIQKEQKVDMLVAMEEPIGSDKIATIVPIEFGDDERPIVLGGPSDNSREDLQLLPIASGIVMHEDYSGVVTQIDAVGGDITQSVFISLFPAWNVEYDATVLADPTLVKKEESKYGAVGRVYLIGDRPWQYPFLPFLDQPGKRHAPESFNSSGSNTNQQGIDGFKIWEFVRSEDSTDQDDDSLWQESQSDPSILPYNDEMAASGLINIRGKAKRSFRHNKFNVVVFEEPQIENHLEESGGVYSQARSFKIMYIQGMRIMGRLGYSTGHKGNFPRPRVRTIVDNAWTKHMSTGYTDDVTRQRLRFTKTSTGLQADIPTGAVGSAFDRSPRMINEAKSVQENFYRPDTNTTIEIPGIAREFKRGTTVPRIFDTDGAVLADGVDIIVRQIEYARDDRTLLHGDRELVA